MARDTILIATDGSPSARLAVEVGLQLARASASSVVFVHASPEIAQALFDENPAERDSSRRIAESDEVLSQALEQAGEYGVEAEAEVIGAHGARSVADLIVGVASGLEARMIVLGSRGRGPVAEAVLGSVSHEVATAAEVPVVIVHAPASTE